MENKDISICIPTYNRPILLKKALNILIQEIKEFNIGIYISDDSTNNLTKEMIYLLKKDYPYIHYFKNEKSLGLDKNIQYVLNLPNTKYMWLLGDDDSVTKGSIKKVIQILNNNKDLDGIIVNACRLKDKRNPSKGIDKIRVKGIESKIYKDKNKLLKDLGWHATFMSTLIYSKSLIENIDTDRIKNSTFPQFLSFFDYLGKKENINIYWESFPSVYTLNVESLAGANWFNEIIDIFSSRWVNAVFSLPVSYSAEAKLECIKNHDKKTGVFSPLKLLYIRSYGYINRKIYKEYKNIFPLVVNSPLWLIYLISIFPKNLAVFMRKIYMKLKGIK